MLAKKLHSNKRLNFYGSRHLTVWGVRQRDNLKSTLFDFASFTWKLISQSDTSGFARQKIANELHKFMSRKFSLFMLKSFMLEHLRLAGWSGKKSGEGFSGLEIMLSFGFIVFLRATRNKLWGEIIHKLGFVTWLLSFASPCECVDLSRAQYLHCTIIVNLRRSDTSTAELHTQRRGVWNANCKEFYVCIVRFRLANLSLKPQSDIEFQPFHAHRGALVRKLIILW